MADPLKEKVKGRVGNEVRKMQKEIKEAFHHVHAAEALKDKTYDFVKDRMKKEERWVSGQEKRWGTKRFMLAGCASFFLVISALCYYYLPVCAVSIDGGDRSSVELSVNRLERVISVRSYDGEDQKKEKQLRHLDCRKAVEIVLEGKKDNDGKQDGMETVVTVIGKDQKKNEELLENLCTGNSQKQRVTYKEGNAEQVQEARALGLSYGKYQAYLELLKVDETIEVEEIQDLSAGEIYKKAEELSSDLSEREEKQEKQSPGQQEKKQKRNGQKFQK